jgi:hypothetical protein
MISSQPALPSLFRSSPGFAPFARENGPPPRQDAPASDSADLSPLAGLLGRQGGASALFEFNYQAVHGISVSQGEHGITRTEFLSQSFEMRLTVAGDPEAAQDLFDRLQAEFTPEKVADRIADFATAGFGRLKGEDGHDALTGRAAFRDFIQQFVEHGFSDALGILGPLADPVREGLDKALSLVREKLDAWVKAADVGEDASSDEVPLT